jgi:hypothetical protein
MLLVFPSQKDFVLVFRGGEVPSDAEGLTPTDSPANFREDLGFIPSFADWVREVRPKPWMGRTQPIDEG